MTDNLLQTASGLVAIDGVGTRCPRCRVRVVVACENLGEVVCCSECSAQFSAPVSTIRSIRENREFSPAIEADSSGNRVGGGSSSREAQLASLKILILCRNCGTPLLISGYDVVKHSWNRGNRHIGCPKCRASFLAPELAERVQDPDPEGTDYETGKTKFKKFLRCFVLPILGICLLVGLPWIVLGVFTGFTDEKMKFGYFLLKMTGFLSCLAIGAALLDHLVSTGFRRRKKR